MMAFYVLALTLAILTIVVVMWPGRDRKPSPADGDTRFEDTAPAPPLTMEVVQPVVARRRDDADVAETMIHKSASPATAGVAPRRRQDDGSAVRSSVRLVGLTGSLKGSCFVVAPEGISIGRSPYSDVVLGDKRVSFRHAWIGVVDGKIVLRDLNSTNGTFLNARTDARVGETELQSGDTIFFGGHHGDQFRLLTD